MAKGFALLGGLFFGGGETKDGLSVLAAKVARGLSPSITVKCLGWRTKGCRRVWDEMRCIHSSDLASFLPEAGGFDSGLLFCCIRKKAKHT